MTTRFRLILLGLVIILGVGVFMLVGNTSNEPVEEIVVEKVEDPRIQTVGSSVEKRKIESYTYGAGDTHLLFVGGVHGGYEWNSVLLAYEVMDYLKINPEAVPQNITVTIIPSLNPDGLYSVVDKEGRFSLGDVPDNEQKTIAGRFNANDVDLNRNFDCKWQPESTWRGNAVSAGTNAFSEPEAQALRSFVTKEKPNAVVFWHSQAGNVYASECENGVLPETLEVMNTYADASGYGAVASFDAYPVTGDAEGWLASIGIPAVTVEFDTHSSTEFSKNIKGVQALFGLYGK